MSKRFAFRTSTDPAAPVRVDRQARVIYGVQVLQVGEAKGHDMLVDDVMVGQAVAAINVAGDQGMKSRWTHPGLCADGMGKMLGRLRNARVMGDTAVADLHLAAFSSNSPDGDLATYAMAVAEQDPGACGMSIVFTGTAIWKMANGQEMLAREGEDAPQGSVSDKPFARITAMSSVDLVDEPAATSGLLAAAFGRTSNTDAAAIFGQIDDLRQRLSLGMDDLHAFLDRYAAARGLTANPKEKPMALSAAIALALAAAHPEHIDFINDRVTAGDDESTLRAALATKHTESLTAQVADIQAKLGEQATAHAEALAAKDKAFGDLQAKYNALAALGKDAPPDPGTSAPTGDEVDREWAALSAEAKSGYWNNVEVYREARAMQKADAARH